MKIYVYLFVKVPITLADLIAPNPSQMCAELLWITAIQIQRLKLAQVTFFIGIQLQTVKWGAFRRLKLESQQ